MAAQPAAPAAAPQTNPVMDALETVGKYISALMQSGNPKAEAASQAFNSFVQSIQQQPAAAPEAAMPAQGGMPAKAPAAGAPQPAVPTAAPEGAPAAAPAMAKAPTESTRNAAIVEGLKKAAMAKRPTAQPVQ